MKKNYSTDENKGQSTVCLDVKTNQIHVIMRLSCIGAVYLDTQLVMGLVVQTGTA